MMTWRSAAARLAAKRLETGALTESIDLAPGNYLLRLGVIDNRTSLIGTTNAKVTIGPRRAATADK